MLSITENLQRVRSQLNDATRKAHRSINSVTLLAVSKAQKINHIEEAFKAGQKAFGESYISEALPKIAALADYDIEWHFIGPIQSNKTKDIANHFSWVQSVDREKIARRLNHQRDDSLPPLQVCAQIDLFDESSKKGASESQVDELLSFIDAQPKLVLRGIMAIPPKQSETSLQKQQFAKIADTYQKAAARYPSMDTLSMGMSGDLLAAIEEGSNMVRVGTGIFGARPDNWKQLINAAN